uniref:Reverse transcriptase domain-containing protein n=1 Tax=Tanacetum cinerariifolium TaxID=118510 RepID=A0A6L2M3Q5_TANCI|nr:reverse transcriptase domain-containing protein [Tanacetum cinerariifolium]
MMNKILGFYKECLELRPEYLTGVADEGGLIEYEALVAGLRIAQKMKVHALKVKVDSKLVACQLNGEFVASNEGMTNYLTKAKEHTTLLEMFSILNIPQNQNQKADVLSKLALVAFNHLTKEFYQWGLDILKPLLEGPGKPKFIIVAIDYFTKWTDAKPLAKTIDEHSGSAPAHRTMIKKSNGEMPFSLTYRSEAVIPTEIVMPTYRTIQFNETRNEEVMRLNLDLIQERMETAAIRKVIYIKKVE